MNSQIEFQKVLREQLEAHRATNPRLSLRSFAKRIGVTPSAVSEILYGKRRVSLQYAKKILLKLSVDPGLYHELVNSFSEDLDQQIRPAASKKLEVQLEADKYFLVADPIYYSILCLYEIPSIDKSIENLSILLKLKKEKVLEAVDRLMRLEYLVKAGDQLVVKEICLNTSNDIANSSLKKRHENNAFAAVESLQLHDVMEREFCFATMAIDSEKIPYVKRRIREFRDQLCDEIDCGKKQDVYELNIQFFPRILTNKEIK